MSVYKCVYMCNSIKHVQQVICEYVCEENGEIRFTFSSTKCESTTRVYKNVFLSPLDLFHSLLSNMGTTAPFHGVAVVHLCGFPFLEHTTVQPAPQLFLNRFEVNGNQNGSGDECTVQ